MVSTAPTAGSATSQKGLKKKSTDPTTRSCRIKYLERLNQINDCDLFNKEMLIFNDALNKTNIKIKCVEKKRQAEFESQKWGQYGRS